MKMRSTVIAAALAALLLYSAGSALAAGEGMMSLKGDLVRVTPETHILVVKGPDSKEVEFTYNDKTEISGADKTIEGLVGKTGTSVTVHYKKDGATNIATKVEVHSEMHAY